ncbi:MAG: hypothetical protein JNL67_18950 [Planctomycetaceae bacterium]|nr:hypothetical protein [Planctomycetaceae bacterium]
MKVKAVGPWLVLAAFTILSTTPCQTEAQDAKATIKAVGLSVNLPDPDSGFGGSYSLGRSAGIEVVLLAEDSKSFLIAVVDDGDEKTSLELSANGETLKNEQGFSNIGSMSQISENGHRAIVPVAATQVPPAGTNTVRVSGKLVLKAGTDEKKDKVKFKVAVGEQVQLGPATTKISAVEAYDFGEPTTNINFETNQALDVISEIKFFDEQGKALEATPAGSSSFGFGDEFTYTRGFQVAGSPKSLSAEVTYFAATKRITVPVDLEVSLSLGGK